MSPPAPSGFQLRGRGEPMAPGRSPSPGRTCRWTRSQRLPAGRRATAERSISTPRFAAPPTIRPSHRQISVTDGRIRRLTYQRLAGRVDYAAERVTMDLRLDQSAGVWLTAKGSVPVNLATTGGSDAPIDLAIASSTVGLGLLEGITDVVRDVTGQIALNRDVGGHGAASPHFDGDVTIGGAAFVVASSGARYKNGRASFALASDRVNVSSFHLEDRNGRALERQRIARHAGPERGRHSHRCARAGTSRCCTTTPAPSTWTRI